MDRIKYLLLRFLRQEASPDELAELNAWVDRDTVNQQLLADLQDTKQVSEAMHDLDQLHPTQAWRRVREHADEHRPVRPVGSVLGFRWAAAAAILILLGAGGWWVLQNRVPNAITTPAIVSKTDVLAPVTNRATITLASGEKVFLDSAGNGALAEQGPAKVIKLADGAVAYQPGTAGSTSSTILYNTLTNPRGSRIISLTLSDGSKVWLNAESSLRYPAVFTGADRRVVLTGEAYFEVTQNAERRFIVQKGSTEVQVLGTHFNVNAYDNEDVLRVTLLEGKVQVKQDTKTVLLAPGEQAVVNRETFHLSREDKIDLDAVMAWKNGLFSFAGADLPTVMRQLSRWYDVEVSYEGNIPNRRFGGKMDKTSTLDQVLQTLAQTRVHYSIDNRHHLTIRP